MRVLVCPADEQSHKESQHSISPLVLVASRNQGQHHGSSSAVRYPGVKRMDLHLTILLPGATLGETTENLSRLLADQ
jgi:hypothetical protein